MELYRQYIREREDALLISEHHGFLTYKPDYDGIFILDVYVEPWYRRSGLAKKMLEKALDESKANKAYTTTDIKAHGWENAEKAILRVGFKKFATIGTLNYYKMEIE
jgi:ribosomal protein S18 acetylase RimI-like enzyme